MLNKKIKTLYQITWSQSTYRKKKSVKRTEKVDIRKTYIVTATTLIHFSASEKNVSNRKRVMKN